MSLYLGSVKKPLIVSLVILWTQLFCLWDFTLQNQCPTHHYPISAPPTTTQSVPHPPLSNQCPTHHYPISAPPTATQSVPHPPLPNQCPTHLYPISAPPPTTTHIRSLDLMHLHIDAIQRRGILKHSLLLCWTLTSATAQLHRHSSCNIFTYLLTANMQRSPYHTKESYTFYLMVLLS